MRSEAGGLDRNWWRSPGGRLLGAVIVGGTAAGLSLLQSKLPEPGASDLSDLWLGARAPSYGQNPYTTVRALHPDVALYYPLPALLLRAAAWPVAASYGQCGVRRGRNGRTRLRGTPEAHHTVDRLRERGRARQRGHGPVVAADDGECHAAESRVRARREALGRRGHRGWGYLTRRSLAVALGFGVISLLVWPQWPLEWYRELRGGIHVSPLLRPGGVPPRRRPRDGAGPKLACWPPSPAFRRPACSTKRCR